jgi:hypothetical protein
MRPVLYESSDLPEQLDACLQNVKWQRRRAMPQVLRPTPPDAVESPPTAGVRSAVWCFTRVRRRLATGWTTLQCWRRP